MNYSDEKFRPVEAWCTEHEIFARLHNGATVFVPIWWYPRLAKGTLAQRNIIELSPLGLHWEHLDEDISIEGMIRGKKAPNATPPIMNAAE